MMKMKWDDVLVIFLGVLLLVSVIANTVPVQADDVDATPNSQSYSTLNSWALNMETTPTNNPPWYGNLSGQLDEGLYPGLILVSDSLTNSGINYTLGIDGSALIGVIADISGAAGDGLTYDAINDELDVNPDNSSVEIAGDNLQLKDDGIDDTKPNWGIGANQIASDDVPNDTTDFDGNLSGSDSDVLAAFNTLDDLPIGGGQLAFYLETTASDIGGYKEMDSVYAADAARNSSASIVADATAIDEWATPLTEPGVSLLQGGLYHLHFFAQQTGGTKTSTIYFELYKRASGGAEVLLGTSDETGNLTGGSVAYDVHFYLADTNILTTDRLVIKTYGNEGGAGTDPVVQIDYQDTTFARFEYPTSVFGNHNSLPGLQGGTADEYYHWTSALFTEATTFWGATDITGAQAETLSDGSDADALHTHPTYVTQNIWYHVRVPELGDDCTPSTTTANLDFIGGTGIDMELDPSSGSVADVDIEFNLDPEYHPRDISMFFLDNWGPGGEEDIPIPGTTMQTIPVVFNGTIVSVVVYMDTWQLTNTVDVIDIIVYYGDVSAENSFTWALTHTGDDTADECHAEVSPPSVLGCADPDYVRVTLNQTAVDGADTVANIVVKVVVLKD